MSLMDVPPEGRLKELLKTLGKTYFEKGQYQEAKDKLKQLAEIEPDCADTHLKLALINIRLDDISSDAQDIYERATELNPSNGNLLEELARLFTKHQISTPFATGICERYLDLDLSTPTAAPSSPVSEHIKDLDAPAESSPATAKLKAARPPTAQPDKDIYAELRKFWWDRKFEQALKLIREKSNDVEMHRHTALTRAYEAISREQTIEDKEQIGSIQDVMQTLQPPRNFDDLRDYLTLRLALPEFEKSTKAKDTDWEEYKFILGLTPIPDYFDEINKLPGRKTSANGDHWVDKILAPNPAKNGDARLIGKKTSLLFAKLDAEGHNIPAKVSELVQEHLSKIEESTFWKIGNGLISVSANPKAQIKSVIKLLESLETYNRQVAENARIRLSCGLVLLKKTQKSEERRLLGGMVKAAHLLGWCQAGSKATVSKLLVYAENNQLKNIEPNGNGLVPVEEMTLLPGHEKQCMEVIWRNPLDQLDDRHTYRLGEIEVRRRLQTHTGYDTFKGRDPDLDRSVILKAIRPHVAIPYLRNTSKKNAIFDAIRSVGRLSHPNIATLFDMGENDSMIYFSREYVDGTTVDLFEFPEEDRDFEFAAVLLKTVQALKQAHEQNVVHLNLKPSNLWITEGQGLKLTDFHIQAFQSHDKDMHAFPPQWQYLAPEVLKDENGDTRSDIYSIGMIMFRVLSDRPFPEEMEEPSDLQLPNNALWGSVLQKAIARNPGNRYQTLAEFEIDLRKVQAELLSKKFK